MGKRNIQTVATVYGDEALRLKLRTIAEMKKLSITEVLRQYIESEYQKLTGGAK